MIGSAELTDLLVMAVYERAVTTRWDCVRGGNDVFLLPRQIANHNDKFSDVKALLEGRYDYFKYYQKLRAVVQGAFSAA